MEDFTSQRVEAESFTKDDPEDGDKGSPDSTIVTPTSKFGGRKGGNDRRKEQKVKERFYKDSTIVALTSKFGGRKGGGND